MFDYYKKISITIKFLKELPSLIIAVYLHSHLYSKLKWDAGSVMDIGAKSAIDKPNSNLSVVSCVQFGTNSLGKGINISLFSSWLCIK